MTATIPTKIARIERNPTVHHVDDPLPNDFPMWVAWSEAAGNAVAYGLTLKECERNAKYLGYETKVWLRMGDNGKERRHPTNKPTIKQRLTNFVRA